MGVEWLLPIIILFVWFLNSILRGAEDERPNRRPPLPGERPGGSRLPRRPPSDIDRFLDEVNRRRRQALERRPPPTGERPPTPLEVSAAAAGPRVPARPVAPRPPAPAPRPVVERRPGRVPPAEPVVVELVAAARASRTEPLMAQPAAGPAPLPSPGAPSPENPPPLAGFTQLLQAPESLCTAVILHEILAPPLCRRHGLP